MLLFILMSTAAKLCESKHFCIHENCLTCTRRQTVYLKIEIKTEAARSNKDTILQRPKNNEIS